MIGLLIAVLLSLPIGFYCYNLYVNSYWKRKRIPFIPARPIMGNLMDVFLLRKSVAEILVDFYTHRRAIEKPFIGIHYFLRPVLFIRDLDLIKRILVKDFASFNDRYASADLHSDLLGGSSLFLVQNPAWRVIRSRMTPFFSAAKLKQMFQLMKNVGNELTDTLTVNQVKGTAKVFHADIKDLFSRYSTDVIASCAFGIEANSLKNPESEFLRNGKRIFEWNCWRALEVLCVIFFPELVPIFKCKIFSKEASVFLRTTIHDIVSEREKSGFIRHDLIDTLIKLRNADKSKHFSATNIVFQGDVIVGQAAVFFTGAFETSSTSLTFGLYELALQPDLQRKLRLEIKESLLASNGVLTYDNVNEMVYLNMVVQETLRMYPPITFLDRKCTNRDGYSLKPYDDFIVPYRMPIIIPIYAIHRDPKYWSNPMKFDPERFSADNQHKIVPYTYLPMGTGPHNCIGERFGLIQMKIGLISFLKNHLVMPTENTPMELQLDPQALIIQSKVPIVLNVVSDPLL